MKKIILPTLIILLSIQGCFLVKPIKIGKIEDISVSKAGLSSMDISVTLPIENQNFYDIDVKEIKIDVLLDETILGSIDNKDIFTVTSKSKKNYTFEIEVNYGQVLNQLGSVISGFSSKGIELHLKGHIKVHALMMNKTTKIDRKKKVKLNN